MFIINYDRWLDNSHLAVDKVAVATVTTLIQPGSYDGGTLVYILRYLM